jgi:F-type H+-transporting ATPase subunit b
MSSMMAARKILRGWLLAILMMSYAGVLPVRAQEPAASPSASPEQKQNDAAHEPGPGQRLAHESREAAGEEKDETAQFKQSASVQWIARHTGLNLQQSYWLSMVLNFAVIAGVIVRAVRKYVPGMLRDRTAAIQKAMQEAQKASEEARRKLGEIESRLAKLDSEIDAMREHAEKEAVEEAARIQAAAKEDAQKIIAAAEQEIAAAAKAARRELTAHAADLAVGLAQRQIRVDAATDQALVRGFSGQLGAAPDGPGKDKN